VIEIIGLAFFMTIAVIAIVILIERSYRVYSLKKQLAFQDEKIHNYENKREEFSMLMSKAIDESKADSGIDPLTQLPSMQAFNKQFDQLISRSKKFNTLFAILVLHFDEIEEDSEHLQKIRNTLLMEITDRLKKTIRDADIAALYGKDKFVVMLPNMIRPEVIVHAVERIISEVSQPIKVEGKIIQVHTYTGIAIYPFDGEEREVLLEHATLAMTKAKTRGKNVFNFYQEETHALGQRELNLKSVIKGDDFLNNVSLEYTPYYDTMHNEVACIKVSASFKHPELGEIPFDDIVRVAHYSSRMVDFYKWMIKTTFLKFENAVLMASRPKRFIFTFNLKQFEAKNFLGHIIPLIKRLSTEENEIIMEITDNDIAVSNLEVFQNSIVKLNESQIPLAIGILVLGHFSINKLNHVHFTYLKIDEKLVKDIGKRTESIAILEKIMLLANSMNIKTLTAGVDQEDQKKILEDMGCVTMQGSLFDKRKSDEGFFIE
jgi:diguanylate cyclase (GGDEF)-like protein